MFIHTRVSTYYLKVLIYLVIKAYISKDFSFINFHYLNFFSDQRKEKNVTVLNHLV